MKTTFPVFTLFCTVVLAAGTGRAEAPRNNGGMVTPPVRITPEIIHDATMATQAAPRDGSVLTADTPPQHDIFRDSPKNLERIPNGCAHNNGSLCYDYRSGSAVYKPMRKLLPDIPGMTPHNLSIRRDKVVAQYTFK